MLFVLHVCPSAGDGCCIFFVDVAASQTSDAQGVLLILCLVLQLFFIFIEGG